MKNSILFFLFILPAFVNAQQKSDSSFYHNKYDGDGLSAIGFPTNKLTITPWFHSFSTSTAVPSSFTNAFIFPGFIDESLKSNAFKRLQSTNIFGGELSGGISLNFIPDTGKESHHTAVGFIYNTQVIQSAQFSSDLFKLVFEGNASYSDKVANFNNSGYFAMSYQTFKLSYLKRSKRSQFRVSAGIARGLSTTQVNLQRGSLYTQPEGEFLDLAWKGNYIQSGNGSNQFKNSPSFGPALDLLLQFRLKSNGVLSVTIQDLGFINWNQETSQYTRDTSFRFTGVKLTNLVSFSDSAFVFGDTLLNKLRGDNSTAPFMQHLPASLQLKYTHLLTGKWMASGAVQYRLVPGYMPFSSIQLVRNLRNNRSVGFTLNYGGYGKFQTGLHAVLIETEHHYLKIGTLFNEGFIAPKRLSGNGVLISYSLSL